MSARRTRAIPALIALAGGLLLFAIPSAWAGGISGALSNLLSGTDVSANGPGYFSSEARGVYLMGGAQVRFPTRTSPALISVNPPYVYAGCGGISAYFGGFNYISGQQIKQPTRQGNQGGNGSCPSCRHDRNLYALQASIGKSVRQKLPDFGRSRQRDRVRATARPRGPGTHARGGS